MGAAVEKNTDDVDDDDDARVGGGGSGLITRFTKNAGEYFAV